MTLEELWELFPVSLVEPKSSWASQYQRMEVKLATLLASIPATRISHIGSTAIPNIMAKDIVDVLIEVGEGESLESVARILEDAGFIRMADAGQRIDLNLGYTPEGFADEVFHIHVRQRGDNDELYFRDYLTDHPEAATEYERLKLSLWEQHEHDRDAYTEAKGPLVRRWSTEARRAYGNRYA